MERIATTYAKVVELTEARVAERPEYVYGCPDHQRVAEGLGARCYYVHTNTDAQQTPREAGCLVGCVLADLGVPLEELKAQEGNPAGELVVRFLDLPEGEVARTQIFLNEAQYRQDGGKTWGESLAVAKHAVTVRLPQL
jgi:hypothetical protein